MALATVISKWEFNGRDDAVERGNKAIAVLTATWPQVVVNIDRDVQITDSLREKLLRQLIAVDVDDAEKVTNEFKAFCRGNSYAGKRAKTAETAILGHVEEKKYFEKRIFGSTKSRCFIPRRRGRSAIIRAFYRKTLEKQKRVLGNCQLREFKTWSCYQSHHLTEPFHGVDETAAAIRDILGLGVMPKDVPIIQMRLKLRDGEMAYRPTAFDAEAYEYFRPGGKTAPLIGLGVGLMEVVHGVVLSDQLVEPIKDIA